MADTDICTLDDVKNYFGLSSSGKAINDDLIEDLITRVTEIFHKFCFVEQFKSKEYTDYYDGDGSKYLFLHQQPVNSITLLADDTDWEYGTDTQIDSDDYKIVDKRYIVLKSSFFNTGDQNIKVTYNAGYDTMPKDLVQACVEETARKYKNRKDFDTVAKSLKDGNVTYSQPGLMESTVKILSKYRVMAVY